MSDYQELSSYAKPHPKDFTKSVLYQRGLAGERIVAGVLRQGGWAVFHAAGVNGEGAPILRSDHDRSDPVPDLDVARNGERAWVEVKTKSHAVMRRSTARYRHGIDASKFEAYLRIQQKTGTKVYIVFYELLSTEILCQSLDVLEKCADSGGGGDYYTERMVFWDRSPGYGVFKFIGSTNPPDTIPGTKEWLERKYRERTETPNRPSTVQDGRSHSRPSRSTSRSDPKRGFQK